MNVRYLINRAVKEYPENVAVICNDTKITFSDLNSHVNKMANGLLQLGVKKGDRIGILLRNCCEYIETDFALSKTGLVRVPLNVRLSPRDHEHMLNDAGANTLVFGKEFNEIVKYIKPNIGCLKNMVQVSRGPRKEKILDAYEYDDFLASSSSKEPVSSIDEHDLHTLFYTSGTTSKPKGVMLTQKAWAAVALGLVLDYGPIFEDDKILNLQPLSHGAGFFVLPFFVKGATNVLVPEFDPKRIFQTIEREKVTNLKLVPTMLYQLLDSKDKDKYQLSSLKSIIYGGAPIAVPRLIEAIKFFGQKLVQLYGQAEAPMYITTLSRQDHILDGPPEIVKRLSSAGKPCLNVEVKIVDEKGNELLPGQVGEIIVRGPHIMKGYWYLSEETEKVLKDSWVYTGDLGYTDSKGYVFLVDRKKDMIISGGFNIYSKEIEEVISTHPQVKDVAVIGVPDEKWGEAVKAVIVVKEEAQVDKTDIIEFCRNRMASLKKPKSVDFVKELPRNPYGKILKTVLKDPYWKGLERKIH